MLNISNSLSLFRLLLSIPLGLSLVYHWDSFTIIICFIAYISDLLDGYLARKLNEITDFGKIIDPLADKVLVGTATLIIIIMQIIPLWFGILIILRDIMIFFVGIIIRYKYSITLQSNYFGKFTVVFIAIALIICYFNFTSMQKYSIIIATFMSILSLINYGIVAIKKIKNKQLKY